MMKKKMTKMKTMTMMMKIIMMKITINIINKSIRIWQAEACNQAGITPYIQYVSDSERGEHV
jgi:hypothetical protein